MTLIRGNQRMASRWSRILTGGCVALLLALPATAEEPDFAVWGGVFDLIRGDVSAEAGLELRFPRWRWDLIPTAGAAVSSDGGAYLAGGVRYDWRFAERWIASPHFAVTLLDEGDGRELGGLVEFRSGLELAYELANGDRLGLSFYHLSNAGLSGLNPGSESLVLVYSF